MAKKKINVGLVGAGFMGRTHSNAFRQAGHFFKLDCEPILKAVATRNAKGAADFAANWGFESSESDWRKLVDSRRGVRQRPPHDHIRCTQYLPCGMVLSKVDNNTWSSCPTPVSPHNVNKAVQGYQTYPHQRRPGREDRGFRPASGPRARKLSQALGGRGAGAQPRR